MKTTRGLTLGFIIGAALGLLIYLRLQEKRQGRKRFLRMQVRTGGREPSEPAPIEIQRRQASGADRQKADNLEIIDGIGPAYAGRLAAAGVETFEALADSSLETLSNAVGGRVSPDRLKSWISQAQKLK